jgi:hypothetical protein
MIWSIRPMLAASGLARIGCMRTHTKRHRLNLPGSQHLWGFDNGHVASAVPDADDANLWQLAVLDGNGRPNHRTLSGPDVIGSLRPIAVRRFLREIEALR